MSEEYLSRVRQIEMPLNAIEPLLHSVKATVLHRDLRLEVGELRLQMSQIHLKTRHANFEVGNLPAHLFAPSVQCRLQTLLPTAEDMELLHNEIGGFIDHGTKLVLFGREIHAGYSASAPEMI